MNGFRCHIGKIQLNRKAIENEKQNDPSWSGKKTLLVYINNFSTLEGGFGSSADISDQCASVIKQDIVRAMKNEIENRYWLLFI